MILMTKKFPLFWFGASAVTLFNNVFVNRDDWEKMSPDEQKALEVHENVHLEQQKSTGLQWYVRYAASKEFRFEQELEAYAAECRYMIAAGYSREVVIATRASAMSSGTYAGMATYEEAYGRLGSMM